MNSVINILKRTILKLMFFGIVMIFSSSLQAQQGGCAVVVKHGFTEGANKFYNKFIETLNANGRKNYVTYDWDTVKLTLAPKNNFKERPVKYAMFIEQLIKDQNKRRPEVNLSFDTSGYVNAAYFKINFEVTYYCKYIDVATGEVNYIKDISGIKESDEKVKKHRRLKIDNVRKFFGKRKFINSNLNDKKHSALVGKLHRAYAKKISAKNKVLENLYFSNIGTVVQTMNKISDRRIYKITIPNASEKKFKHVEIDGGTKNGIESNSELYVYAVIHEDGKKRLQYIVDIWPSDIQNETAKCKKSLLIGSKSFTKKMREHKELIALGIFTNSSYAYPESRKGNTKVFVKGVSTARKINLEKSIMENVAIDLVERNLKNQLDQLRALYTDERFIDMDMGEFQGKQVGAEIFISFEGKNLKITDINTNKQVSINKTDGKRNWLIREHSDFDAFKVALMKHKEIGINYSKVVKEKKGKVKKILVFHPYEFGVRDKLDLLVITEEKVLGKVIKRKEYLTKGYVKRDDTNKQYGVMSIGKNKKKLFKILEKDGEIDFMYSIKR